MTLMGRIASPARELSGLPIDQQNPKQWQKK